MTAPPPTVRLAAAFYRLYIRRISGVITDQQSELAALIDQQQHLKGDRP
jgi:hypothetical protein